MKNKYLLLLLPGFLLLQSCVVANYKLRNELDSPVQEPIPTKAFRYAISVNAQSIWNFRMTPEADHEKRHELILEYRKRTQAVFDRKGIPAICATNSAEANFLIDIVITPFAGALPQEQISGLTLCLVPVWGTRPNELAYTFEEVGAKKAHSYYVDQKTYIHWFALPVFWVNIVTMNEARDYRNALRNYLGNIPPEDTAPPEFPSPGSTSLSESKCRYYRDQGDKAMGAERWKEAERAFRRAMTQVEGGNLSPDYRVRVLYSLAEVKLKAGAFDEAAALLEQALDADEKLSDGVMHLKNRANLSNAYYEQGKIKDADKLFEQTLTMAAKLADTDNASVIYALVDLSAEYFEHGRFNDGAKLLHIIDQAYPSYSDHLGLQTKKEMKQLFIDYAVELRKLGEGHEAGELEFIAEGINLKRQADPTPVNKAK